MTTEFGASNGSTSRRKRLARWLVAVLLILIAGGAYAIVQRPWEIRPVAVEVEVLAPDVLREVLAVNGRVAARESVNIRSAVTARANAVMVDEGDRVTAGDQLVELDTAQAEALVAQAQAALDAGEAQRQLALATAERTRALGDVASRSSLENAELNLATATKEVERLQAALDQARDQLGQYTITSPLTGVVLERTVDQGQLVDTQSILFSIADIDNPVVETDVDEVYSARLRSGLPVLMKAAGETQTRPGTVSFAAPRIDPATGGRAIAISFDEAVDLPIGMTVNANIVVSEIPDALSVPRRAILEADENPHVFVIVDGVAETRAIQFADWPAPRVRVIEGLGAGERVILEPELVSAGDLVEPK